MIRQLPAALFLAAAIAIGVLTDSYYEMVAGAAEVSECPVGSELAA